MNDKNQGSARLEARTETEKVVKYAKTAQAVWITALLIGALYANWGW